MKHIKNINKRILDEGFKMPRKHDHNAEPQYSDIVGVLEPTLKKEILGIAADAAIKYLMELMANCGYHTTLPVLVAENTVDKQLTVLPFMYMQKTAINHTVIIKILPWYSLYKEFTDIDDMYFVDEMCSIMETAVEEKLGAKISVKCEFADWGIRRSAIQKILGTTTKVRVVSIDDSDDAQDILDNMYDAKEDMSEDFKIENIYGLSNTVNVRYSCACSWSYGQLLNDVIGSRFKFYRDFVSQRIINPAKCNIIINADNDGAFSMREMCDDLATVSAEDLIFGPQTVSYINLTAPLWIKPKELKNIPSFDFIKSHGLPIGIITRCRYISSPHCDDWNVSTFNHIFGWNLTEKEYNDLRVSTNRSNCEFCIIWPAGGTAEFTHPFGQSPRQENTVRTWKLHDIRQSYSENVNYTNMDDIPDNITEAFKMPTPIDRQQTTLEDKMKHINDMLFPVFSQEVKVFAEKFLLNYKFDKKTTECPYRFLKFSSYMEPDGKPKSFITPGLTVIQQKDGYLLTIKSCAVQSLNIRYNTCKNKLKQRTLNFNINIGGKMLELARAIKSLEDALYQEYHVKFNVKMELIAFPPPIGHVWLDNDAWMCELDVEDHYEAERIIDRAVDIPFPCIPIEYKNQDKLTLNICFIEDVTLSDFLDFVETCVLFPNNINAFNIVIGNIHDTGIMSDNQMLAFLDQLRQDSVRIKSSPIKVASVDFRHSGYNFLRPGTDLSWICKNFQGAGVIFSFIPGENLRVTEMLHDITRGLYTETTADWLTRESKKLIRERNTIICHIIWYSDTGEICYETDFERYNVPREFLGRQKESCVLGEAFKMPVKHKRADKISATQISKVFGPVVSEEIKEFVCKMILGWNSKYNELNILNASAATIVFFARGTEDNVDISDSVSVSVNNGKVEIIIMFGLMLSSSMVLSFPSYRKSKSKCVVFDPRLYEFMKLLDEIKSGVVNEYGYDVSVVCRQIDCDGQLVQYRYNPRIIIADGTPFEEVKFPYITKRYTVNRIELIGGLSVGGFKKFINDYVIDILDKQYELIPDWISYYSVSRQFPEYDEKYDLAEDLYGNAGTACKMKFTGVVFKYNGRTNTVAGQNGEQRDLDAISDLSWLEPVCGVPDPYFMFTCMERFPGSQDDSIFYTKWTDGKLTWDVIEDKFNGGWDDAKYFPKTGILIAD